jgi:hypothetical protein
MIIDGDKLINILSGLADASKNKYAVLKEPAVYYRIIEIIKHMDQGIEPVPEDKGDHISYHCAVCGYPLFIHDDRCEGCGTKVNWRK